MAHVKVQRPHGRSGWRAWTPVIAVVWALVAVGSPATATTGDSDFGAAPRELQQRIDDVTARIGVAQDLVRSKGLGDVVRAAAQLEDVDAGGIAAADWRAVHSTPATVSHAVDLLLVAVDEADALARRAAETLAEELDTVGIDDLTPDQRMGGVLTTDDIPEPLREGLTTWRSAGEATRLQYAAGLVLADAVDVALPILERDGGHQVEAGLAVDGCDIVDDRPRLCVGGTGDNTYTADYELLIDLGGDDTHANSAGGANPDALAGLNRHEGGNGLYVSVAIDVAGNDVYSTSLPTRSGSEVAGGAGFNGGVGLLVDVAGKDDYRLQHSDDDEPRPVAVDVAGFGLGRYGFGMHADLTGADTYSVQQRTFSGADDHGEAARAWGVGVGQWGTGILFDGDGDDTYLLEAAPQTPLSVGREEAGRELPIATGPAVALGLGWAAFGGGFHFDGGGEDAVDLRAATAPVEPDDHRTILRCPDGPRKEDGRGYEWQCSPHANAGAHGMGRAGFGMALSLSGPGDTTRTVIAESRAPETYWSDARGFGLGTWAGVGALVDGGGDDTYLLQAGNHREAQGGTACEGCSEKVAARSIAPTQAHDPDQWVDSMGSARVHGMGAAQQSALGLLWDVAGDDVYTGAAIGDALADLDDTGAMQGGGEAAPTAFAQAPAAFVEAQGVASYSWLTPPAGLLLDGAGDDVYELIARSDARADASEVSDLNHPSQAFGSGAIVFGQAAVSASGDSGAYAELRDASGGDAYRSTAESTASAQPSAAAQIGTAASRSQGSVNGIADPVAFVGSIGTDGGGRARFIDGGIETDVFMSIPANPACTGQRGQGLWVDCIDEAKNDKGAVGTGHNQF